MNYLSEGKCIASTSISIIAILHQIKSAGEVFCHNLLHLLAGTTASVCIKYTKRAGAVWSIFQNNSCILDILLFLILSPQNPDHQTFFVYLLLVLLHNTKLFFYIAAAMIAYIFSAMGSAPCIITTCTSRLSGTLAQVSRIKETNLTVRNSKFVNKLSWSHMASALWPYGRHMFCVVCYSLYLVVTTWIFARSHEEFSHITCHCTQLFLIRFRWHMTKRTQMTLEWIKIVQVQVLRL